MTTWTAATEQAEPWSSQTTVEASHALDRLAFDSPAFDVAQLWEAWIASTEDTELWTAPTAQAETWSAVTKQTEVWSLA